MSAPLLIPIMAPPTTVAAAPPSALPAPRPCGALECLAFPTPEAAFAYVLQRKPRILALGEAHAQEGTPGIRSSTRRFAEQLLPMLAGKSKHIVIELPARLVRNRRGRSQRGLSA
ncbi:MAG: hypothetical protein ABI548_15235 [Polyangiaceae bacterium]